MKKPSIAIFIKSYPPDYVWLNYCLRSILKYVTGHAEVVVAIPEGSHLPLTAERIVHVREWNDRRLPGAPSPGYYQQMSVKIHADTYTDCDYIFYVDSDCVFTRLFDMAEMFDDGKPLLLRRRWEDAGGGICWKEPAELALRMPVKYDTMACHPSIYRRDSLQGLRAHMEKVHGTTTERYIRGCDKFIEFVTIGNFILNTCPEQYRIIDRSDNDEYPRPLIQNWSWGGMTPEIAAKLETIVG